MLKLIFSLIIIFFLILSASCKKDAKDEQAPFVKILSPLEGNLYHVFDTIPLILEAEDETQLKKIEIYLKNEAGQTVLSPYSSDLNDKKSTVNLNMIIDDFRLLGGNYYLEAIVYDGENSGVANCRIHIIAAPNHEKWVFLLKHQNNNFILSKLDTLINDIGIVVNTNYPFSIAGNSFEQQVYSVSNSFIKCFDCTNNSLKWQQQINGITNSACTVDEKSIFVSLINGNCIEYSHQGVLRRSYLVNETSFTVASLFSCSNYLIVSLKNNQNNQLRKTIIFEKNTSIIKAVLNDNIDYVKAFSKNEQEIFLIGNSNNQGKLFSWNSLTGAIMQLVNFQSTALDAILADDGSIVCSAMDGNIYQYNSSSMGLISLNQGTVFSKLNYSSLNNKLYCAYANQLSVYRKNSFSLGLIQQFNFSDTLKEIVLLNEK